jgi:heat shock protein HslJ
MRPVGRFLAGVSAVLLLAAGCGDDDTVDSVDSEDASGTALEGTPWVLSADAPLGVALEAVAVTAQFDDGRLSGHSGCNSYTASYEVDGDSLTIGPDIAGTNMACPPAQSAIERAYLARLPKVTGYEIDGDTLTMKDDEGETILRFEATDSAQAIQGEWTVTSYYDGGTAITSVLGGVTMTAEFSDGTVSGSTGCNSYNSPYEVDGQDITIGPFASTLAACGSPELDTQQNNFLAALELARTFEVAGDRLDLFREDGGYAVSFTSG